MLPSCLFSRYIRGMLHSIASSRTGCYIGNLPLNVLAYADDIVLLSPSWRGLQYLIDSMFVCGLELDMACNDRKTVCMVLNPQNRHRVIKSAFPLFKLGSCNIPFVQSFRHLGHIISASLCDNEDIEREIKNTFVRTNMLIRRFKKCSFYVKTVLFRSFCLGLYDTALWSNYTTTCIGKLTSCYNKCIKSFLGYSRTFSLTQVLLESGLPSFDTVLHNSACIFRRSWQNCPNTLVKYFNDLHIYYWCVVCSL